MGFRVGGFRPTVVSASLQERRSSATSSPKTSRDACLLVSVSLAPHASCRGRAASVRRRRRPLSRGQHRLALLPGVHKLDHSNDPKTVKDETTASTATYHSSVGAGDAATTVETTTAHARTQGGSDAGETTTFLYGGRQQEARQRLPLSNGPAPITGTGALPSGLWKAGTFWGKHVFFGMHGTLARPSLLAPSSPSVAFLLRSRFRRTRGPQRRDRNTHHHRRCQNPYPFTLLRNRSARPVSVRSERAARMGKENSEIKKEISLEKEPVL
ncbi:hypothetical protein MTO96_039301 [Rhipicephalus appendiculatus]